MLLRKLVTIRHTLLAVGAVLVLGMAIYLFREVGRAPSDAHATVVHGEPPPSPPPTVARSTDPPSRAVLPTQPARPVMTGTGPVTADTPPPTPPQQDVPPPDHAEIGLQTQGRANPKLDAIMAEANKAYDHGDFDEAKQIAEKVIEKNPGNVRMLRILVSSECIAGDAAVAQKYFAQLPAPDRAQMRTRCDRYGVTLKDP